MKFLHSVPFRILYIINKCKNNQKDLGIIISNIFDHPNWILKLILGSVNYQLSTKIRILCKMSVFQFKIKKQRSPLWEIINLKNCPSRFEEICRQEVESVALNGNWPQVIYKGHPKNDGKLPKDKEWNRFF